MKKICENIGGSPNVAKTVEWFTQNEEKIKPNVSLVLKKVPKSEIWACMTLKI